MNERIKELAEQAGAWCYDHHDIPTMEQFQEKFAELVMKESARIALESNYTTDVVIEMKRDSKRVIAKYFKVTR
jgi:hypothetical protein